MGVVRTIWADFKGLRRVVGNRAALRWLWAVTRRLGACKRAGNLQPADLAMGEGPFRARLRGARSEMVGPQVISGIREIWVRDVYLGGGFVSVTSTGTVVDLGANMGNFTMLALGHGAGVRVVAVEPSRQNRSKLERQIRQNGWAERVQLCGNFIGGRTAAQDSLLATPEYADAQFVPQEDFLRRYQLDRIDFLKCDIEGSEFDLLTADSPILARTRQLAIEVHDRAGDRKRFIGMLERAGFEVRIARDGTDDCILQARRPEGRAS